MPTHIEPYEGPAGGWGSAKGMKDVLTRVKAVSKVGPVLWKQNKPEGFMCVSCAWAKPKHPHAFEFCENGAKATAWELTPDRCTPAFFAEHTVSELRNWSDFELEMTGRLTEPMRYDRASDKYVPVSWDEAFAAIGSELKAIRARDPQSVIFYASGRASLETSFMYGLLARAYGNNNLPDSSNMCHETTSVALPRTIGVPVGTVLLEDFDTTDLIITFGQNVGTNSPRLLHPLQEARKRGIGIVTFNPLRERGWERFRNPQAVSEMIGGLETQISTQYHQVHPGGDIAACFGVAKALLALEDAAQAAGHEPVLDHAFIAEHTHGFEHFEQSVRAMEWSEIEKHSGLKQAALERVASVYSQAKSTIFLYGMGLTQHVHGIEAIDMVTNLMLMRGNIGRPGAGICPVRGHSNVQGQRTVGITEKPELVPNDKLRELFHFEPPMQKGMNTVEACEGILAGEVEAFIGLGGNFVRAIPDTERMSAAWSSMALTVQVATKLNHSHLVAGKVAYLLPCIARSEIDRQEGQAQAVSMEDSTTCVHGSWGQVEPASEHLLSEPRIVAGIAEATLEPNPKLPWSAWARDYASVRDAIEATYPDQFEGFNSRLWKAGGFPRPLAARHRVWTTPSRKANFFTPEVPTADGREKDGQDVLRLVTVRSNDQFNTTVYGYDDRFRGIEGTRMVVMMSGEDIARLSLKDGDLITLRSAAEDGHSREVRGLRIVPYSIPSGSIAGYFPELNALIPVTHHAEDSFVPAGKSVPVLLSKEG
ncbi:MAG: formate dehydrogenase [Mesorhizobium amorphae]|nr:MAG: formate dehydrogenase [Mesorhizobium amorphae]